jgi:hypothetical protein
MIMAAVVACGLLAASSEAMAQRSNRSVSRPTLSPYLNMYRNSTGYSTGHTDPYGLGRSYLSPSQRLQRQPTTSADRATNPPRSPEMMRLRGQNQQQPQAVQIAPTGANSGFMNTSHFYPARNAARR